MRTLRFILGFVTTVAAFAHAQQIVVPAALANGPECCAADLPWGSFPNRVQCIYDASNFTSQGVTHTIEINTIEFREGAGAVNSTMFFPSVEVYLEDAAVDFRAPSTLFSANRSIAHPRPPNFAGPVTLAVASGTTPNSYVVSIPLAIPFSYSPVSGRDLLVEVVVIGQPVFTVIGAVVTGGGPSYLCNSVFAPLASGYGIESTSCPLMRLTYVDLDVPGTARHEAYGAGCGSVARSWYEHFVTTGSNDLSGKTISMTQNILGGYDVSVQPVSAFTNPAGVGLALGDDVVSAAVSLPFTFQYPGGSTSSLRVDSNGRILLNGSPQSNNFAYTPVALLGASNQLFCPSHQDLLPDGAINQANVFAEPNGPSEFDITWRNVPCYNVPRHTATSTFQVALIDNGTNDRVEFRYLNLVNDSSSFSGEMMVGFSDGGGSIDPGNRDLTALGFFATGGDTPALRLDGVPRPILGNALAYSLQNMRALAGVGAVNIGFGSTLPVPLSAFGLDAPGCFGHIDVLNSVPFGPLLLGSPTTTFSWTWPAGPYVGAILHAQGVALAPFENGSGILTSNGLKITLGSQ